MIKLQQLSIGLLLIAIASAAQATNATWTGQTSSDLNTAANWNPATVPSEVGTFQNSPPPQTFHPTASSLFEIGAFFFPGNASAFDFTFSGPGWLTFNGAGITGNTTDTTINATNTGTMATPQIWIEPATSSSIGSATISATNQLSGVINGSSVPISQILLGDPFPYATETLLTADQNASITVLNSGTIESHADVGQILLTNSTFTADNNFSITATNTVTGSIIEPAGRGDSAQMLIEGIALPTSFTAGNFANLSFGNHNASIKGRGNTGQLLLNANVSVVNFSLGDHAIVALTNDFNSIIQTNSNFFDIGQIFLRGSGLDASIIVGDLANFTFTNNGSTISNGRDAGQCMMDGQTSFTTGNNLSFIMNNSNSLIEGSNTAGQLSVDGTSSFFTKNDANFVFTNNNSVIQSSGFSGQFALIGSDELASFSSGDFSTLIFNNINSSSLQAIINAGQLNVSGFGSNASFSLGNQSILTLNNTSSSSISADTNSGQLLVCGAAITGSNESFSVGDHSSLTLNNTLFSSILNLGSGNSFAGQLLVLGGAFANTASFTIGDYSSLTVNNTLSSTIQNNTLDVAQILVTAYGGSASLTAGAHVNFTVINDSTSSIVGNNIIGGQIVVEGASLSVGNYSTVNVTNSGTISVTDLNNSLLAGQIVFNGSTLNGGVDMAITATNSNGGVILNTHLPAQVAQIYFRDTTVNGNPIITAVNEYPTLGSISGIVFDGSSTAPNANIALQNTSLVVNTTNPSPFIIASLAGDSTSIVQLYQDLEIDTVAMTNTTFAGDISDGAGANNLIIAGSGTQTLSGENTFGGNTTVKSGTLVLNGSVLKSVFVNGGILAGTGTIDKNLTVNSGGTVSPGNNSIGTLNVNGDYIHNSGGTYFVQFNDLGESSLIEVGGVASLNGGTVIAEPIGIISASEKYLIVHADYGVIGKYQGVSLTSKSVSLIPFLAYDPDDVYLEFLLSFPASTCTQKSVASVLNTVFLSPTIEAEPIIQNLISLSNVSEAQHALDQISGVQYTSIFDTVEINTQQFLRRLYDPLRLIVTNTPCVCCSPTWDAWLEASGGQAVISSSRSHPGFTKNSYEISGGAQCNFGCNWTIGAGGSYVHDNIHYRVGGRGNQRTTFAGLYSLYRPNGYYILGDIAYGYSHDTIKRPLYLPNAVYRSSATSHIKQGIAYGEAGFDIYWSTCPSWLLQPFIGLEVDGFSRSHIREKSDNALGLILRSKSRTNCFSRLGIHLTKNDISWGNFTLDLAWQHRYTNDSNNLNARFQSFGNDFKICGRSIGRNGLDYAITYTTEVCARWQLYLEASGQVWSHASYYDILGGIKYSW